MVGMGTRHLVGALGLVLLPARASAANAPSPGTPSAPYPTLENLALEWPITGDDNDDATVSVHYKRASDSAYLEALPLVRVPAGTNQGFDWANRFAGSIFGLEPGTTYDVRLELTDPDGGDTQQTLSVSTRPVPVIPADAHRIEVTPDTIAAAVDASAPGDMLVLADGSYDEIDVTHDGTEARPIVIRAENPGGATVEGDIRLDGRAHVFVEDLRVHGKMKFNDASSLVIRGNWVETPDFGLIAYGSGVTNAVIMNNVVTGVTPWTEAALGAEGANLGEGIQFTGAGNVVAYNRVSGFRDCLSLMEDDEAVNQVADDFYGNDLSSCADDAIEADFAMGNVRVYQNRMRDSFMGVSSQPSLGGPTYFVRNVMYNVLFQAFKLQRSSVGDVGYHNTVVKTGDAFSVNTEDVFSRATFRNNLFIGGPGGTYNGYDSGPGEVMTLPSADASCSFDYDGYGSVGTGTFAGRVGDARFASLSEMQSRTTEVHGIELGLDAFAAAVPFPSEPFDAPPTPSLLLAASGAAVDQGTPLPNVNDAFAGSAPDLGAYELGEEEPTYGPLTGPTAGGGGAAGSGEAGAPATGGGTTALGGTSSGGGTAGKSAATGGSGQGPSPGGGTGGGSSSSDGAGQSDATTGGAAGTSSRSSGTDAASGCGCRVAARSRPALALAVWLALGGVAGVRRRRSVRRGTRRAG